VAVQLLDQTDAEIDSAITDADGRYAFADLSPATYSVRFTAPEGFRFTSRAIGGDAEIDSDADELTGATTLFSFDNGDLRLDIDAGLVAELALTVDGPEPFAATDDFQINVGTSDSQTEPATAELADGSFAVVWTSASSSDGDSDGDSVQLQRYGSDGSAVGGELQVNTLTTGDQESPGVAALPDGGFVVVWQSDVSAGDDGEDTSIQRRLFDASGSPVGGELQVNQTTTSFQNSPVVAAQPSGDFLVAWEDLAGVRTRVFDSAGDAVGAENTANTAGPDFYAEPAVTALENDHFAVVWTLIRATTEITAGGGRRHLLAKGDEGEQHAIQGRIVGSDGDGVGGDFQISNRDDRYYQDPTVAAGSEGFLVAWSDGTDGDTNIDARLVDNSGNPLGSQLVLTNQGA
ncbi:MAG: SdrD B-like domain-containing protein, partial [Acidobacteriota bacterium]